MFSAVITVKAIWVFSLPSKKQNISLLSHNSQNKKKKAHRISRNPSAAHSPGRERERVRHP